MESNAQLQERNTELEASNAQLRERNAVLENESNARIIMWSQRVVKLLFAFFLIHACNIG